MAKQDKIGSHKTTISVVRTMTVVTYHNTDVIQWGNKTIMLNSGGWRTATTKLRMNQASRQYGLGIHVFQSKGKWYVNHNDSGITLDFVDDMVINRKA